MGNIYRRSRSPYWYLDFFDAQGKRVRRSAKTQDEKVAWQRLEQAVAAVSAERTASDPDLHPVVSDEADLQRDAGLAAKLGRLEYEVHGLSRRLAYCERQLAQLRDFAEDAVPRVRDYARKLAWLREVLDHCLSEIERSE
jgi:hypothetical protein